MGPVFSVERFSGTRQNGGEWETALGTNDEPWEDQSWEEPEEAEVLDDDWTDELPPEDPELEDQFGSLEAAEAYAVTEFKNASSDMRNATRTFLEATDLVSRVKHARGYFPVVDGGAFDGFQTITPRGSRQTGAGKGTSNGMNTQAGKCKRGEIVQGDKGPVGGVAQVVCHGVIVVVGHQEEGQEQEGEKQGEVEGEVEESQGQPHIMDGMEMGVTNA